ncbi:glycine betaine ABC transporter substrate-binding protein [Chromohalobacter salexigens]|uniref:Glycine/betaine ABC transporter substrate-binding protein n=1 Tax=Chromohalobacter japonicus TaxID=223900 RepID=A0A1Q8TCH2_9GAMM|nr:MULTISPECIES: glycine betaine ABC transporter substrate-binding protein [Chromohalobacter]NWO10114.1 glycine betaine ABC transporter substrate-binding protein [Chromohalobacter salexigens]CDQ36176.1 Glycine betaine/carnitine transport binding protein GbuC precursor [Virgibacillus halodenitrificans]MCK2044065.1 glycine betaine ABC transporter substrate-binding protein [Chromohalobacter moromii]MCT8515810.1 glycine betaine ABC transporter substrate-binding protein [Chromohalobacter sp. TMW 2.2
MTRTPLTKAVRYGAIMMAAGAGLNAGIAQAQDSKGDITLAYVEWSSEVASTNVVRAVLEEQGYNVKMSSLSAAAMWQAVAYGDADGMVAAWLPSTHEQYLNKVGDKVENLGPNLEGTKLGLVVPSYTDISSIDELDDKADVVNDEIVGIDPGAGLMNLTEKAIEEYDLGDAINLQSGSGATMTAALDSAIKNDEDIVVAGWTPHWMFARWDLKYLDDPKNVYGGAEHINTVVRQGLKDDMPEAYAILDNFEWTPEQMGEVMLMNQEEDSDPYENAKKWVDEHPDVVDEWVNGDS